MTIITYNYIDPNAPIWTIELSGGGVRRHKNLSKYNLHKKSRDCQITGCLEKFKMITRQSGLCDTHNKHTNDLIVKVLKSGARVSLPGHVEIIEKLLEWALTRNFQLEPFFESLGANILGNIPDVSTLDGFTPMSNTINLSLKPMLDAIITNVVDATFPSSNSSSYQLLKTKKGDFPARTLATILASLLFCEEANRGDRWFCRNVLKDETKTKNLGAAMPVAYFAARRFKWGVQMKDVLPKAFR